MKILLTGGTGFIGTHLGRTLVKCGHEVIVVSRNPGKAGADLRFTNKGVSWKNLSEAGPVDGIVHLAGDNIAARWTKAKKEKILQSRVELTRALIEHIQRMPVKPKVLVSASAVGVYGDRGEKVLKEDAPEGDDFLAGVCHIWEREALLAESFGVRTAVLRLGLVLGNDGGALKKMLPAFKLGVAGRLGSGEQWMSWIHVKDLTEMICFALENGEVRGRYNAVAPRAVRNNEFTKILGKVLGRPTILPVPAFLLKGALGEMSGVLLGGQHADSGKIVSAGFTFRYPELEGALRELLVRN